jgi:hypothetical protein
MSVVKLGNEEYEELPRIVTASSKMLVDTWEFLGRPDTPLTDSGSKLLAAIIAVWEELYPADAKRWYSDRKDYARSELPINEQIYKHTGRSLASYPFPVFQMMKKLFPKFKPGDRQSCMKLVAKFPLFRMANKT